MGAGASTAQEALGAAVTRLAAEDVPAKENVFWQGCVGRTQEGTEAGQDPNVLVLSSEEVFSAISPDVVRRLCKQLTTRKKSARSGNLRRLVRTCTDALVAFAEGEMRSHRMGDTDVGPQETNSRVRKRQAALNALRILTRLIPLVMEDPKAERLVFWDLGKSGSSSKGTGGGKDEAESNSENAEKATKATKSKHHKTTKAHVVRRPSKSPELPQHAKRGVPEAHRLVDALQALMFIEDFTVGRQPQVNMEQRGWLLPLHYVWAPGVGTSDVIPPAAPTLGLRVEVLRCMLTCFSAVLFEAPLSPRDAPEDDRRGLWIQYLVGKNGYYDLAMFFSLLNAGLTYDPIGWGVPVRIT
jgi:High-temperature-induced dauer-formation protein